MEADNLGIDISEDFGLFNSRPEIIPVRVVASGHLNPNENKRKRQRGQNTCHQCGKSGHTQKTCTFIRVIVVNDPVVPAQTTAPAPIPSPVPSRVICHAPKRQFSKAGGKDRRKRCTVCVSRKTFFICKVCNVPLCVDNATCWESYREHRN
jgi:hypothetical protein